MRSELPLALVKVSVNSLSQVSRLLYADQDKLIEAEAMYARPLQGYEDALGPELVSSYLPGLNTMFSFGDILSQTDRKDMAVTMYNRALSGYTIVQGPSLKRCNEIQGRLQELQLTPARPETVHVSTKIETAGTNRKLRT